MSLNADEPEQPGFTALLAAVCSRILPSDGGPGEAEAGVAAYVDKALQEERLWPWRELMEQGLEVLDGLAEESFDRGFARCSADEQDDILRQFEAFPGQPPRRFMRQLVELCLEGFFADPRHGGNRDELGWASIGYRPAVLCDGDRKAGAGGR